MRSRLEECLETNEIPYKTVYHGQLALRRECLRQGDGRIGVNRRILAAKPVRRGVRDREASGESAISDLMVVVGVTPTSDTAGGVGIPEGAVLKV